MSELKCSLMNLQTWLKSWNLPTAESDAGSQSRQKQDISKPSLDLVFFRRSLLLLVIARDVLGDEDVDDLQREHRAELLLGHARLDELALRHRSVVVLVHLVERWKWANWKCEYKSTFGATCLDKHLLAGLICICLVDQQKKILDYLLKLLTQNVGVKIWSNSTHFQCYRPVVINVEDAEYLLQVFLWGSFGLKTGILVMSSPGDPLDMM